MRWIYDFVRNYINEINARIAQNVVYVSGATYNVTITQGYLYLFCDAEGNNITVNLLTAVGNTAIITVKKTDDTANTVTIDCTGAEFIDGGGTAVLRVENESITFISDDANYRII